MLAEPKRLVGVLGGMGALATVDFLSKVSASTPATCDQDHIPLLVYQMCQIPDRTAAIIIGSDAPFQEMLRGATKLVDAGAELLVVPCNSAHYWHARLAAAIPIEVVHIVDAVRTELERRFEGTDRLAIVATRGTVVGGVYERRLPSRYAGLIAVDDVTQRLVDHSIALVKASRIKEAGGPACEALARLKARGAQRFVLGCTELPMALTDSPLFEDCVDSGLALARMCVALASSHDQLARL